MNRLESFLFMLTYFAQKVLDALQTDMIIFVLHVRLFAQQLEDEMPRYKSILPPYKKFCGARRFQSNCRLSCCDEALCVSWKT